ncbi:MAG TPA: tetratricopeptide repeat-containing sensor histidine kinase, partial [Chitinophagaceae bacterium]|nr:tetratricopeptide repeat-containing sensor histidine kinase [Chitinophagaceae bacterium]
GVDSAIGYYERSLLHGRLARNSKRITVVLFDLLYIYINTAGYTSQRDNMASTIKNVLDTTSNSKLKIKCYENLGNYYSAIGWYEQELNYRLQAVELSKAAMLRGEYKDTDADSTNLGVAYFNIGDLYEKIRNNTKAQEYYLLAKPLLWNYDAGLCEFYKGMSFTYTKLGKTAEAKSYADSLRNIVTQRMDNSVGWGTMLYLSLSNADFYLDQQNTSAAMPYLTEAEKWVGSKVTNEIEIGTFHYTMGKALVTQKNYKEALPYLKKAEIVGPGFSVSVFSNVLRMLAVCHQGLGQWQEAGAYYSKYLPLRDSLDANTAQQSMANAEARFQNKEKQQQIEIQHTQLSFARKQNLWLIAGLGLLGLLAIVLIAFYRNKKKTADILNEKNVTLANLNTALEEANHTKSKLFSIISHDLRSPISQVYQFLKLQQLNPQSLDEQQRNELSNKIQSATGSLLETMEDLLLWSKTQMNEFKTDIHTTALFPIVEACQKLLQLNSEAKNIRYTRTIPENIMVKTDPYYLQTILRNLLQNAVKASPENGEIQLGTEQRPEGLIFYIQNHGGSFTQEQYKQIISSEEHAKSLNGLGLRLADELSQKIGATITFRSPETGVTRVEIMLP